MRILYGVNGEGLGHATRSRAVIAMLLAHGHDVRVVASGRAVSYLSARLPRVDEIFGPSFVMDQGEIHRWATLRRNVFAAGRELPETARRWLAIVDDWRPHVVVTDFEPLAALYARTQRVPLVSVDNIHMLVRCHHDDGIIGGDLADFVLARAITRAMVPTAGDYVVTTFFRPRVRWGRTSLVPPIVRDEVIDAVPERGEHVLVYSSGDADVIDALRKLGVPARVYGMRNPRPRSDDRFLEDLRTARAVVTGGGFSLLSESIYLRKPVLSMPLHGQFEQLMNARYLEREGYGLSAPAAGPREVAQFLDRLPEFEGALARYEQDGNRVALETIEACVTAAATDTRQDRRRARRTARKVA
ncbi:MAG TPA: glycosyltransferase family protein [Solirubrobacter sp.]|nr:glycosyltransferase family protein [Solirubrobacter sp.]